MIIDKLLIRRLTGKIEYRTVEDINGMIAQGIKFIIVLEQEIAQ